RADHPGRAVAQQPRRGRVPTLHREHGPLDQFGIGAVGLEGGQFAGRRYVVGGPQDQPDPLVAERGQVPVRLVDRVGVVGADAGEAEILEGRVDQYGGQPALVQPVVVVVVGGRLRVQATGEDHAGDVLVEQHLDVVGLGYAVLGAGTQDRGEAAIGT